MSALKFTRIKDGYNDGDYKACAGGIEFSIVRCIRPVRFALSATRNGKYLTGYTCLWCGTLRSCKDRAQNILDKAEAQS